MITGPSKIINWIIATLIISILTEIIMQLNLIHNYNIKVDQIIITLIITVLS